MIIAAFRNGQTRVYTKSAYQFDKGQTLIVTGVALPDSFDVHMANGKEGGLAYSCKGNPEGTPIPDALFVSGEYIYIWIYRTDMDSEGSVYALDSDPEEDTIQEKEVGENIREIGETKYEIIVPIVKRPVQLPPVDVKPEAGFGYMVDDNGTLVPVVK